jgi:thiamine-phosphate pyrophosphorylase
MIVITNPIPITNEIDTIHALFESNLELLHIRKPYFSDSEMKQFLSGIHQNYSSRLVMHSHHHLVEEFKIKRIHISESKRKVIQLLPKNTPFDSYKTKEFHLSTSVHSIEDFNTLDKIFEYAFISPIYPSISKENYYSEINWLEAINHRTNYTTKLIALGGIESNKVEKTLKIGFDNVAILGTIWNSNNPIKNFKSCQKIVQSF